MSIHIIIGEDDYLVSETAKRHFIEGAEMDVVDSATSGNAELQMKDLAAVTESIITPPFLYPAKVTWWKNVGFLPQGGKGGPSEMVKTALENFAKKIAALKLPENQVFILTGPRLLAKSRFLTEFKNVAEVALFASGKKKSWEAAREAEVRVVEMAEGMGLRFERGAASIFVSRVGTDTRSLMSELGKMRDYLGSSGSVITAAAIDEISSQGFGVEPEVWAVTDALGDRDAARALSAVRRFEQESGFAVMMTTVIEKFLRQLMELKAAADGGRFDEATAGMPPFAVRKQSGFLRRWTLLELRQAQRRFFELREKTVSTSGSADVLVVAELMRACGRRG